MPKHSEAFAVSAAIHETLQACKEAVGQLGWGILEAGDGRMSIKEEGFANLNKGTWPAKVDIHLQSSGVRTQIILEGSIFGFGPIQSDHLKGQMGRLRSLIERSADRVQSQTGVASLGVELERLASMKARGVLTEDEFEVAKKKLLGS